MLIYLGISACIHIYGAGAIQYVYVYIHIYNVLDQKYHDKNGAILNMYIYMYIIVSPEE